MFKNEFMINFVLILAKNSRNTCWRTNWEASCSGRLTTTTSEVRAPARSTRSSKTPKRLSTATKSPPKAMARANRALFYVAPPIKDECQQPPNDPTPATSHSALLNRPPLLIPLLVNESFMIIFLNIDY